MPRRFRLWEKKRGNRLTGSKFIGSAGEAVFFVSLAGFGLFTLAALAQTDYLRLGGGIQGIWGWLFACVLILLTAIGGAGFGFTLLSAGTSVERRHALAKKATDIDLLTDRLPSLREFPNVPRDSDLTNSPGIKLAYRLPIEHSPGWRLLIIGLFTLLWNITVGVLIWLHLWDSDWYLTALTIPFAALGLTAIAFFLYSVLLATAIGPTSLEISELPIVPGSICRVFLTQAGRLSVKQLTVTLVCEEEATYRQGTDTRTERRRVHQQEVFSQNEFEILPVAPFETECELHFPEQAMHSFRSDHNAIRWRLVVEGVVEKWSGFERNFPIVVYPSKSQLK